MKKTVLGAIVIFFVMFACVLAIHEILSSSTDNIIEQQYTLSE